MKSGLNRGPVFTRCECSRAYENAGERRTMRKAGFLGTRLRSNRSEIGSTLKPSGRPAALRREDDHFFSALKIASLLRPVSFSMPVTTRQRTTMSAAVEGRATARGVMKWMRPSSALNAGVPGGLLRIE